MKYELHATNRHNMAERSLRSLIANEYRNNINSDTHLYDHQRIEEVT